MLTSMFLEKSFKNQHKIEKLLLTILREFNASAVGGKQIYILNFLEHFSDRILNNTVTKSFLRKFSGTEFIQYT